MTVGELLAYIFMLFLSIFSIWITTKIIITDELIIRAISLIPAGLITAIWIAMTLGILSALKYRNPDD
jgi:hypothetical protein